MKLYSDLTPGAAFPPFQQIMELGYYTGTPLPVMDLEDDPDNNDPEGGCGCGENCDRGAGWSCPLEELYTLALARDLTRERINYHLLVPGATLEDQIRRIWQDHGFEAAWNFICLFGKKRN